VELRFIHVCTKRVLLKSLKRSWPQIAILGASHRPGEARKHQSQHRLQGKAHRQLTRHKPPKALPSCQLLRLEYHEQILFLDAFRMEPTRPGHMGNISKSPGASTAFSEFFGNSAMENTQSTENQPIDSYFSSLYRLVRLCHPIRTRYYWRNGTESHGET